MIPLNNKTTHQSKADPRTRIVNVALASFLEVGLRHVHQLEDLCLIDTLESRIWFVYRLCHLALLS